MQKPCKHFLAGGEAILEEDTQDMPVRVESVC